MSKRAERQPAPATRPLNLQRALAIGFLVLIASLLLPVLLDRYVVPKTWDGWWFIAQTLAGNWSPPDNRPGPLSNYWFLFVSEMAILLNFGPYVFLFDLLRRVVKIEEGQAVELNQVLDERDSAIITILLSTVPKGEQRDSEENRLTKLFSDGHEFWLYKLVPAGHDPDTAAKIVEGIKTAKFGPS